VQHSSTGVPPSPGPGSPPSTVTSSIPIRTWKDLLFPNGQDTRISLKQVENTGGLRLSISVFSPPDWEASKLPSQEHLVEDLLSKMHEDLNRILEEHYAIPAGGTSVIDPYGIPTTPSFVLGRLRKDCEGLDFRINHESDADDIATDQLGHISARNVSQLVRDIHYALTRKFPVFRSQEHTDRSVVITDHAYKIDGAIKILWEDKSPNVFNAFVGRLMNEFRAQESRIISFPGLSPIKLDDYQGILGKVRVVASVTSLLSGSSLRLDFLPFQGCSAPGPLGSLVQRTPVHHYLHPTLTWKAYLLLFTNHGFLP
jgi:hypothetical protein